MSVRAKFKVNSITQYEGGAASIKLNPVTTGSDENKAFYKYTPCGSIDLQTVNEEAAKQFVVGAEFYVDFSPAAQG